ncbi:MATE family efflux transporter [Pseudoalteromonas amylolytica]|uniref:MATE family efflux transporter n=2 Tax=Pseudoalteromonas TaxID=53246 RepID=A0A1S1MNX6_9GAMM|nr:MULTISPECIES: MATE family efflux transporter [Pseudoalteromonas]OHU86390.1 MATE family efflux transporter [Pseudoalteromonas sp. JW3]OHU89858.1 MATE family efflux transporter [Pseudoalteromonas amylolytica]
MILSNISVPLLGLVDTAVIGHLSSAHYLAGIALGASSIAVLFWLASFLRMSTTGVIAQALGSKDTNRLRMLFQSSIILAMTFAITLVLLQPLLMAAIAKLSGATEQVVHQAQLYFSIRIYSAPAALCNLVLLGFMLGMHFGKGPFYLVLFTNVVNIILDILFVVVFEWGVAGAAWASLIADYSALGLAIFLVQKLFVKHQIAWCWTLPTLTQTKQLLSLNRDIFIRSLLLQLCFSFMTFYGARLGETTLAANAVLLNFLMLVSFALDGIAYAAEAKVGHAKGQKNMSELRLWVRISVFWGSIFALLYALFFATLGRKLIQLLTDIPEVVAHAQEYLPWLTLLPLIAMGCFIFDGVFVGLTRAKAMRNSMLFSAAFGFFLPFALTVSWQNHGLWFAMSCFMALRGATLLYRYSQLCRQGTLLQ